MKFLALKDGTSVRKDKIIMVERLETGGSRITTDTTSIESIFPYESILSMIENDAIEENISGRYSPAAQSGPLQFWRG